MANIQILEGLGRFSDPPKAYNRFGVDHVLPESNQPNAQAQVWLATDGLGALDVSVPWWMVAAGAVGLAYVAMNWKDVKRWLKR